MEIRPEILDKHLADAALEQLTADYASKGFSVDRDVPLGDVRADLVARKGESLLVFEVKAGAWTPEKRQSVQHLRDRAVHEGGRFILVLVPQHKKKVLEVEGLENTLLRIVDEQCQSELDQISSRTRVTEITDIDLESLEADPEGIEVSGSAHVGIELQFGSDSDTEQERGFVTAESVPVAFHVVLDHSLKLKEVLRLELDLKDLYS